MSIQNKVSKKFRLRDILQPFQNDYIFFISGMRRTAHKGNENDASWRGCVQNKGIQIAIKNTYLSNTKVFRDSFFSTSAPCQ